MTIERNKNFQAYNFIMSISRRFEGDTILLYSRYKKRVYEV